MPDLPPRHRRRGVDSDAVTGRSTVATDSDYHELRAASCFSFLRAASTPEDLAMRALELGLPGLALSDRDGVHGAPRFHQAAKSTGIRPIFGAEVTLDDESLLILLVRDLEGWRNLCRLLTEGHADRPKGESRVTIDQVARRARGLTALTGWSDGRITRALREGRAGAARAEAGRLVDAFGRDHVFLEVQRHLEEGEEGLLAAMRSLAHQIEMPIVATNGVRFATEAARRLADVLACVRHRVSLQEAGPRLLPNAERRLKSAEQMRELFSSLPGAVRATRQVAEQCSFTLDEIDYRLPHFPVPEGETDFSYLYRLVHEEASRRYRPMTPRVSRQLAHELDVIERLDFAGYFLVVWDVVRACRERGILCQGRGSAANSAVCYCLGITAVDPVGLDLLFERFLSESRAEPPDIDLDIAHAHREPILQYVYEKYGRDHAAMVCEVIGFRARSAVRDVGKALGLSHQEVDRISKALGGGRSVDPTEEGLPGLMSEGDEPAGRLVRDLLSLVAEIDEIPRHLGIHVGGMVLSRDPLCEIVPVEPATMDDRTVIQWNKDDAATLGLVKIDLLGLGMLTLIQEALRLVEEHHGRRIDLADVPMDDPATYDLLCAADTVGVFQVESRAQMSTLPRLKPRCFHDLVVEVSLIRPGPIQGDMVHPYLRRRSGEEPVTYPHPSLEPVLARTLGVPLFQEQGMKLAVVAAGFSPAEADSLRRAMGHSRSHRKMAPIVRRLRHGMAERGFDAQAQETVIRQIESFASFGFAESHAASFALLVAVSAWLKVHYPVEFSAALFTAQPMGFYSPATIAEDARRRGVEVLPPCVNESSWDARVVEPTPRPETAQGLLPESTGGPRPAPPRLGSLRLGLRSVRGLGEGLARRVRALAQRAPHASLAEYVRTSGLPRPVLENLAAADAFRCFGLDRRQALWEVSRLARSAEEAGPLFTSVTPADERVAAQLPLVGEREAAALDHRMTGVGFGPHPISFVRDQLAAKEALDSEALRTAPLGRQVVSGGLVICRQQPGSAKGTIFLTLEDERGFVNVVVRKAVYRSHRLLIRTAPMLVVRGRLERVGPVVNVLARSFEPLRPPPEAIPVRSRDFQ